MNKKRAEELGIHLDDLFGEKSINDVYIPEDIASILNYGDKSEK